MLLGFQLSFLITGDTGVESSSTGLEFIGSTVVSMKGFVGVALVVVCLMGGDTGVDIIEIGSLLSFVGL